MSLRETGKQRAKRIEPQVLKGTRWLERGRFILAALAAIGVIAWWGTGLQFRQADAWASPGPVAAVHSTWANDCNQCHTDFQAIRDDAVAASSKTRAISDAKCQKCHPVSRKDDPLGPFGHHALAIDLFQFGCSTCHHEHRGNSQPLARASDDTCTICHERSDLGRIAKPVPKSAPASRNQIADIKVVMQFSASGHPYFRSLGDPELGPKSLKLVPRHLKFANFSHHLHMMPGMAQGPGHQAVWTLGQIPESDRLRYVQKGQRLSDPVQLTCGSCHQSDSRGFGVAKIDGLPDAALPANSSGAYMLPITFENQCRACHALTIEADVSTGIRASAATVPHRLTAAKLAEEVQRFWEDWYFKNHPMASQSPTPVPGHTAAEDSAASEIKNCCRESAAHLNRVCGMCHEFTDEQAREHLPNADPMVDAVLPRVAPVEIPQTYLIHATFSHLAHRAIDCSRCHQDCYPAQRMDVAMNSADAEPAPGISQPREDDRAADSEPKRSPLMIANRDTCLECHGPRRENAETSLGGARFDCAECHQYHSRDQAVLQNRTYSETENLTCKN